MFFKSIFLFLTRVYGGLRWADVNLQALHFKLRVLDLLEIFVKRHPDHPLILDLIVPSLNLAIKTHFQKESRQLHEKLGGFIRHRLAKIKENPVVSCTEGLRLLREVHDVAKRAPTTAVVSLCSQASLVIVRALAYHCPSESVEPQQVVAVAAPSSVSKKQKKSKESSSTIASLSAAPGPSPVSAVYRESLDEF